MPKYLVNLQNETTTTVRVEAVDEDEAKEKAISGQGVCVDLAPDQTEPSVAWVEEEKTL